MRTARLVGGGGGGQVCSDLVEVRFPRMAFIDARTLPSDHRIDADVCVVGAGAAGLALAHSFLGGSRRVVLLESGGLAPDPATQALYAGSSVGAPHAPLVVCRLRYFGGTTNHWTAHVRPLDPLDFEARPWIPHSGWPFGRAELDPYYARTHAFLGLPERSFEVAAWERPDRQPWRFDGDRVVNRVRQVVAEERRRLGPRLHDEIARSRNVDVCLFANVLDIELAESRTQVKRLRVGTLEGGRFTARARWIVLATGGIENARILLLSDLAASRDPKPLPIGRFYANHPEASAGEIRLSAPRITRRFYGMHPHERGQAWGFLSLPAATQRSLQLGNCWLQVAPDHTRRSPIDRAVARHASGVDALGSGEGAGRGPGKQLNIRVVAEPTPNPESRVRLGDERDALGQRRVVLDWRIPASDSRHVRETLRCLARELGASGIGRARIRFPADGFEHLDTRGSHHHMGTTRMHRDPSQGVVDADCRVHGISNLFVAGSSVFPSYGTANPTYTLLALAFRLADHLKGLAA